MQKETMSNRPIICSICLKALDSKLDEDGVTYIHGEQHGDLGHEPDPIEAPADWRGACDFCSTDQAVWELPAKTFTAINNHISAENWAACNTCAALIEKNQWNALVRRVKAQYIEKHPGLFPTDIAALETQLKPSIETYARTSPAA
ncbi:hypothetical protein GCM10020255_023340 [Rhodococcus baikonurensis]